MRIGYVLPVKISDKAVANFISYTKDTFLHARQKENALNLAKKSYSLKKLLKNIKVFLTRWKVKMYISF